MTPTVTFMDEKQFTRENTSITERNDLFEPDTARQLFISQRKSPKLMNRFWFENFVYAEVYSVINQLVITGTSFFLFGKYHFMYR